MLIVSQPCPNCGNEAFYHIQQPAFRNWVDHGNGIGTATIVYFWNHTDKALSDCGPFETEYRESVSPSGGTRIEGTKFG